MSVQVRVSVWMCILGYIRMLVCILTPNPAPSPYVRVRAGVERGVGVRVRAWVRVRMQDVGFRAKGVGRRFLCNAQDEGEGVCK